MGGSADDLRQGIRSLFANRRFTAIVVITLALGIGLTSAIFTIVDAVLLRPLPYPHPEGLVRVFQHKAGVDKRREFSVPNFFDLKNDTLEDLVPYLRWNYNVSTDGATPKRAWGAAVSANTFRMLGAAPILGRTFSAQEDGPGGNDHVVVLSSALWQSQFAGDPKVLGRPVKLEGDSYTIIGVMPRGFDFPEGSMLWTPIALTPTFAPRGFSFLNVAGRMRAGASLASAQSALAALGQHLEREYPDSNKGVSFEIVGLQDEMVEKVRPALLVLLGAVAMVLLIACANVAHLLLARATARESEFALRTALGAGRFRLVRQLLIESVILGLVGGAGGLLLAYLGVRVLVTLGARDIPRLAGVGIDARILLFTLVVSLLSSVLFGLVPALRGARADLTLPLKEGARAVTGHRGRRLRRVLVFAEIAVALVLVVGAGLLIKSFGRLTGVDPGFNPKNALTLDFALYYSKYPQQQQTVAFFNRLIERVEALPGVRTAGTTFFLPFDGRTGRTKFLIVGRPQPPADQATTASLQVVTPHYFKAMGIPLERGRVFTDHDIAEAPPVALINQEFARDYWPGQDPIGQKLKFGLDFGPGGKTEKVEREVVGVVGNVRQDGLEKDVPGEIYIPNAQATWRMGTLVVRTSGDPLALGSTIEKQIWAIDPGLAIDNLVTLEQRLDDSVSRSRFSTRLLTLFALVALLLAAVGIYGVLSYSVSQQTQEIGIRLALGASRSYILRDVLKEALLLVLAGVALGVGAALGLSRLLASLLFGVSATDPATFASVSLCLLGVALVASYLPARRAARVDPLTSLRNL